MIFSPSALVLFFSLASIGTSSTMTPDNGEALHKVSHAQNLVSQQTPHPSLHFFPSFLLIPYSQLSI